MSAGFGFALGVLVALSGAYTLAPRHGPEAEAAPGLVNGGSRSLGRRATASIHAYELYLRGHIDINRWNDADLDRAIVALEAAIAADSTFAEARAVLANAYLEKADLFQPNDEYAAKAHVQAGMALLLDPDLPLAHIALGNLLWTDANHFPHEAAFREFARAAELGPDLSSAHDRLALVYLHVGLLVDALAEARRGAALDPLDLWSRLRIGHVLLLQHHYAEAADALRAVPADVAPALRGAWLAEALLRSGQEAEAERLLDSLIVEHPRDPLVPAVRAVLRASHGDSARARLDLAHAAQRVPGYAHGHHAEFQIGVAYVMLGRPDSAVAWLDRAARHGFPCYPRYAGDPLLRPLRRDPRFLALLDRLRAETAEYGRRFAANRRARGQERADTSRPGP